MIDLSLVEAIKTQVDKHFEEEVAFLLELVGAESVNAKTVDLADENEPIEREVAKIVAKRLKKIGFEPEYLGKVKERKNVVLRIGNLRARKSLIFNGHMDTSKASSLFKGDPLKGYVRDGEIFGLGVYDMKAALAAYVYVAKIIKQLKLQLKGKLIFNFVVDEETGACSGLGTKFLLDQGIKAKAAVVAEPGEGIGIGHRGGYRFKLIVKGKSAHTGSTLWQEGKVGKNAILEMVKVIKALEDFDLPYKSARAFPDKKPVLTFPTLLAGGVEINRVPDECVAYGDVRLMPGNSDKQVRLWIEERLSEIKGLEYELIDLLFVPAVEIEEKEEIVEVLRRAYELSGRRNVKVEGIGPWNDGWMLCMRDIPAVVQVPLEGGTNCEGKEWVSEDGLKVMTMALVLAVVEYLGVKQTS